MKIDPTIDVAEPVRPHRKHRSAARSADAIDRSRELRRTETESEDEAWRLLRRLRFKAFKFRRQHPLGRYIVDFCCPQQRLSVELDGSVHAQPNQVRRDARRDTDLRNMGYTVARFSNGMVLSAPDLFVDEVLKLAWLLSEASG
jgi:very-short-patch-repair endonuclease